MYDVIVVGGGPIGCYLAKEFADKGLDVLILEKNKEMGLPTRCSGHVSNLLWHFIPEKEDLIENKIRGAKFHVGGETYDFKKDRVHSYVINRPELDKYMAKMAKEAGVEILTSHKVSDIFNTDSHATIYAKNNNELKNFQGKVIAGCDGPNSTVKKTIGSGKRKVIYGLFCYIKEEDYDDFVDVFPSSTRDFFAWRIPRGEKVEYGLASKYVKENYANLITLVNKFNLNEKDIVEFHSGVIPLEFSREIIKERVFLVGDAAGTVKPFTGGGIVYGLTSAKIASKYIDPKNPQTLKEYERGVKKVLGKNIQAGKLINKFYRFPPSIQKFILKIISRRINDFHMDKPSKILFNIIKG